MSSGAREVGGRALLVPSSVTETWSQRRGGQRDSEAGTTFSLCSSVLCSWAEGTSVSVPLSALRRWLPPHPSFFLPPAQELPRFSYFILQCPIQKSFQRPQPCQRGACTKGLFDFLFVFICQWRGRGAGEKELLGFKIFIWVASFSEELAPWNSFLS